MSTIAFDDKTAEALVRAYLTTDVIEQRRIVLERLELRPGEAVLDIGPGPGLLLEEIAACVGSTGQAVGVDVSAPMLELAQRRCAQLPWVRTELADAAALPYPPNSFDAVVSTQVYEYVEDIPNAFAQLFELTRSGGRVAILDTDYDAFVLHTHDQARHARVLRAWDAHFVHRGLPRVLAPELRRAGFAVRSLEAIPIVNTEWTEHEFSFHLLPMMAEYCGRAGGSARDDAGAWLEEQRQLAAEGRFFFSLNRYLVVADKPK